MRKSAMLMCMLVLGFISGYVFHECNRFKTHWQKIEDYKSYVSNPAGWKSAHVPPQSPDVSLSTLESVGELQHIDLVFPNVPYESGVVAYWMSNCLIHPNIVFAFGNPSYVDFKSRGVQPLHINLWFKKSAVSDVQRLISDIDSKWGKE